MRTHHCVYILVSEHKPSCRHSGFTSDLADKLRAHNSGQIPRTRKNRPWRVETVIAFRSAQKAADFVGYLNTHSGRAFAEKHF